MALHPITLPWNRLCFNIPGVAEIIRGPPNHELGLTLGLQNYMPNPEILAPVIGYARQWDGNEDLIEPSVETYDRHAAWDRRIEQSRVRLYKRLHGSRR